MPSSLNILAGICWAPSDSLSSFSYGWLETSLEVDVSDESTVLSSESPFFGVDNILLLQMCG